MLKFIALIALALYSTYMESVVTISKARKIIPITNQLPA